MIDFVLQRIVPASFALLPRKMDSAPAVAMLLAIGLQETRFLERRQRARGPARSFWQFEPGEHDGFALLFKHRTVGTIAGDVCRALRYAGRDIVEIHEATEHNDVLACAMARLLLWTHPKRLPLDDTEAAYAWQVYLEAWRPGEPHPETWASFYKEAWARITGPS